jgi:hypothetical protein
MAVSFFSQQVSPQRTANSPSFSRKLPDFAFPQIESRLGVVTLFPLPLRPEKQV